MESQLLENTNIKITCHDADKCLGEYCTIHNRSDHVMRSFPQMWRSDRGFMERICPHGVGHPDPDEVYLNNKWDWSHACDGCCLEKNTSIENTIIDDSIIDDSKYKRSPIGTIYKNNEGEIMQLTFESSVSEKYSKHEVEWYWRKAIYDEIRQSLPNYNNHPRSDYWHGVERVIDIIMQRNHIDQIQE